jgi:hypothetical protein
MTLSVDLCTLEDYNDLTDFIRDYWSATHVLAHSRILMDWQHRDEANKRYNFIAARDSGKGIVGILGFIPTSRYDPALAKGAETLWLTTWKVRPDFAHGLGLLLLRKLETMLSPHWIGTVGLNPATRGIYQAMGYHVAMLARHYMLNEAVADYRLSTVPAEFRKKASLSSGAAFRELDRDNFWTLTDGYGLDASPQVPRKTRAYLHARYLLHPFYSYRAFLIVDGRDAGIAVVRECSHQGASALRVVDFLGAPAALAGSGGGFQQLLADSGAEYADFFCSGLEGELSAAGFSKLPAADVSGLILPGHFEPFERANVDLAFSLRGEDGLRIVCKGDADQDRPNLLQDRANACAQ